MKVRVNQKQGGKYAAEREWAYDLIANSTGTTCSEMADMMVEQFGHSKQVMTHTLLGLVANGSLKVAGHTTRNGRRTFVLAAVRRAKAATKEYVGEPANKGDIPKPVANGSGVSVVIDTAAGQVTLTVEQAKAISAVLGSLFK